jgi:hypothetical protein
MKHSKIEEDYHNKLKNQITTITKMEMKMPEKMPWKNSN